MIAPDAALIANAVPVLPLAIAKSLSSVSPVVATVITEAPDEADSATLPVWLAVMVTSTSVTVIAVVWAPRVLVPSVKAMVRA